MKKALDRVCRELREIAETMSPGPLRDQLHADITCFKVRLMALPARVAAHAPFDDADQAREVLEREIETAFSDVKKWIEPS